MTESHFTQLDTASMNHVAAEFALGGVREWAAIAAGTINSNFRLTTDTGQFFVRVNEGKSLSSVQYEVALLEHWTRHGVAAPLPLVARGGERYLLHGQQYLSVFPWLAGGHLDSVSIEPVHCLAMGRELAKLHIAGLAAPAALHVETRYSDSHLRELFASFANAGHDQLAPAIAVLSDEFDYLAAHADGRAKLERGLIHADLFPDNVLLQGEAIVSLLDFEQACGGALLYDLAVCVNAWCFATQFVPERFDAMLAGYLEGRGLASLDMAALRIELRAAALRFTITRITDVHLKGMSQVGKDFGRFLMRLEFWRDEACGIGL